MKGSFGSNFELLNVLSSRMNDDIIQLRLTPTIDPTVAQVDSNLKSLLLLVEDASRSMVSITIKIYLTRGSSSLFLCQNLTNIYDRDTRKCP